MQTTYVPEQLYLNWKNRALVSRKYATELSHALNDINIVNSQLHFQNWLLRNENEQLKRTPDNKLRNRLFKTQQRLFKVKQELKEVKQQLEDVLKNENGSI